MEEERSSARSSGQHGEGSVQNEFLDISSSAGNSSSGPGDSSTGRRVGKGGNSNQRRSNEPPQLGFHHQTPQNSSICSSSNNTLRRSSIIKSQGPSGFQNYFGVDMGGGSARSTPRSLSQLSRVQVDSSTDSLPLVQQASAGGFSDSHRSSQQSGGLGSSPGMGSPRGLPPLGNSRGESRNSSASQLTADQMTAQALKMHALISDDDDDPETDFAAPAVIDDRHTSSLCRSPNTQTFILGQPVSALRQPTAPLPQQAGAGVGAAMMGGVLTPRGSFAGESVISLELRSQAHVTPSAHCLIAFSDDDEEDFSDNFSDESYDDTPTTKDDGEEGATGHSSSVLSGEASKDCRSSQSKKFDFRDSDSQSLCRGTPMEGNPLSTNDSSSGQHPNLHILPTSGSWHRGPATSSSAGSSEQKQ